MMKKLLRFILGFAVILLVLALALFAVRQFNERRYPMVESDKQMAYMMTPTNIEAYPKTVEGATVTYVDHQAMQGFHFVPKEKRHEGVIICFGGSEGSPNFAMAARLAEEGYETLAVFMFGMPHQPKTLVDVPLEAFEDVLDYAKPLLSDGEPLTVLGASKGAEYALNLATKYKRIDKLILIAPAAYNFSGLDFEKLGSSWTWQGKELPYIDVRQSDFGVFFRDMLLPSVINTPVAYKNIYDSAIDKDTKREDKLIPVETIQAKMLLIAGEDDQVWNSATMGDLIKKQLPDKVTFASYKDAGHIFRAKPYIRSKGFAMKTGGSQEGNRIAGEQSWQTIKAFLEEMPS